MQLTFVASCVIEEEPDNFVVVEKMPNPDYFAETQYSYNGDSYYAVDDTLWMSQTETMHIRLEAPLVYGYDYYIDGTYMDSGESNKFEFMAVDLERGSHQLEIVQHIKSGTGSLADRLNAEWASISIKFVLEVGYVPNAPKILNVSETDGNVLVEWEPYRRGDFQEYTIIKKDDERVYTSISTSVYSVTDQNQTSWFDPTYVGGHVVYTLYVNRGGSKLYTNDYNYVTSYVADMSIVTVDENTERITWEPPTFYKNISSIEISKNGGEFNEVSSPTQNYFDFPLSTVIGNADTYYLKMIAHREEGRAQEEKYFKELVALGERTPAFNNLIYNEQEDTYLMVYIDSYGGKPEDGIFKLDKDLNVLESNQYDNGYTGTSRSAGNIVHSPDLGQIFVIYDRSLIKVNKETLAFEATKNLGLIDDHVDKDQYSVSNNGLIVYHGSSGGVRIYDFNLGIDIFERGLRGAAHISPDGTYFVYENELYQYNGSGFDLMKTLPYTEVEYVQFYDSGLKLLITTSSAGYTYDHINDAALINFPIDPFYWGADHFLDQKSLNLSYRTSRSYDSGPSNSLSLVNIENGQERLIGVNFSGQPKFIGNYIFTFPIGSNEGFAVKISDL